MIIYEPASEIREIPVIDLADALHEGQRRATAEQIHRACRETGFFYIVNHGVPLSLIERQFTVARAFFDLPLSEKLKIDVKHSAIMRGYEQIGAQTLDQGSPPDMKESLMFGRDLDPEHPFICEQVPYEGPNPWPSGFPELRTTSLDYIAAMIELGRLLAGLLALSLDLPEDYFADGLKEPSLGLRMLRYPPQADEVAFNQLGAGAHTDWGLITMLSQDDCGGLEVKTASGRWIRAEPVPGSFIVNLGDMVPRLTGGLYTSNFHRVLNNISGRNRHSIASFFNPHYHYSFRRVPTCNDSGEAECGDLTFGEHIAQMFEKTYGAKS